jgi:epoxyqueuosine reductase
MTAHELAARLKAHAADEGFDLAGIAPAIPPPHYAEYLAWLRAGLHGEMAYLERHAALRAHPEKLLPGARSVLVVGLNYARNIPVGAARPREGDALVEAKSGLPSRADRSAGGPPSSADHPQFPRDREAPTGSPPDQAPHGRIAKYALGGDYHKVIRRRLQRIGEWLVTQAPGAACRVCVDSAPVLERDFAVLAGLGWYGKNTLLINTRRGSYFLLGCLLTTVALPPDAPAVGDCGTCRACLDACPTGAIVEPYRVDARRCISYLTIEKRGDIDPSLQPMMGDWVFGCDVCQDVCPFNRPRDNAPLRSRPSTDPEVAPRIDPHPPLADLMRLTPEQFADRYAGTALMRAKHEGLLRNARIAGANAER